MNRKRIGAGYLGIIIVFISCLFLIQMLFSLVFDLREYQAFDKFQFGITWAYAIALPALYIALKIHHHFRYSGWLVESCAAIWMVLFIYSLFFIV
jgi:hypothetical protein